MGLDFVALGTGAEIRQALDVLEAKVTDGTDDGPAAITTVRARVEALETRLNTARRTAWVAVPVEAETIAPGDVIVAKDGVLWSVTDVAFPEVPSEAGTVTIAARSGDRAPMTWPVPFARPVPVLRRPTADALDILTRQLGAQVTK